MGRRPLRWALGATMIAVVAALAWRIAGSRDVEVAPPVPTPAPAASATPSPPRASLQPAAPAPDAEATEPTSEELAGTWENVDLEAIRAEMPDNTYFQMAAPTDDPRILEQRDAERARWNDEYGKVLAGDASEAEIDAFFEHRHRVAADYVEFTNYVLEHHQSELPPRDVALLELARRLQLARLAELPRRQQEAHARKAQQDAAREAWRADEQRFRGDESD